DRMSKENADVRRCGARARGDCKTFTPLQRVSSIAVAALLAVIAIGCGSSTTPGTVASVAVTGTAPSVGTMSQFTATATLTDGTTQDVTTQATWSSSNTT